MADEQKPYKNGFKFPKQSISTKITDVQPNRLSTRGYNQEELITNLSYAEMVFLILKGRLPKENESKIFNHILVSFCDHGVTPPSTQAARIIASSGANLNNAVAGGLLSFGKNHAGAIEKAMNLFQNSIKTLKLDQTDPDDVNKKIARLAIDIVNQYESKSRRIPGFGHRYHDKDPRAVRLLDLAILESAIGPHTKLALVIESILSERKGICLNVDGVNAGLLSDMGFDSQIGLGIFMIGRLPGLIAHSYEEIQEEEKFRRFCDLEDISYDGLKSRNLED
ncbi:MAG: citryl-CoA lyase [Methanobrevibacter sp.]|nr:citryl-CoA lyase [Methanobrevibacter sp.]